MERWVREALEMRIRDERENAMLGTEKGIRVYVFEARRETDPHWSKEKALAEACGIMAALSGCFGLETVQAAWPRPLAAFHTLKDAKEARKILEDNGKPCGKNIMWGRWYKAENRIEIKGKAEE